MPAKQGNPVVYSTIPRIAPEWEIREYASGQFDAADRSSSAISPGFDNFYDAYNWLLDVLCDETL